MPQEAGNIHCVSIKEKKKKSLSIRISQDVTNKRRDRRGGGGGKNNGWFYLS